MARDDPARRVASLLLSDAGLAARLRQMISDSGGDQVVFLRAREVLEDRLEAWERRPDGPDYAQAASLLGDLGRPAEARLLTAIACTENRLMAAAFRWERRYDGYTDPVSVEVREQAVLLDLGHPQRGIDGALCRAGRYGERSSLHGTPVAVIDTRAACELVTGWDSPRALSQWIRSRMAAADGPLGVPGNGPVPRFAREEQLLAFGLRYPWELDWLAWRMSGYTFTCDVRDEIFSSAMLIHRRGGTVDAGTVAGEVSRRYSWAPAWARQELGGAEAPWIAAYVRRLAITELSADLAVHAAHELSPGPHPPVGAPCQVTMTVRPQPVTAPVPPAELAPRAGPVPRM